ncbi:fimbrial protein [Paraburkholderia bannensis]|uniref:fimbrial protein n=1 Tax=Paraburkholderia bannensis TaxID=765414 RepID=UPI002AB6732A|nr:fimbrial protein [Paraburkholderia bannensis]
MVHFSISSNGQCMGRHAFRQLFVLAGVGSAAVRIIALLIAILAASLAGRAFAADATLNFSGTILQPSCNLDSSTANQTVNLGSAQVTSFAAVGSTGNPTAFYLSLVDCSAGTNVTMTVSGTIDTVASVLKNTGTATQVGVQILQAGSVGATTGSPLTINSAVARGAVDSTNSMTIPLVAQFYRLGPLTAGTVTTTATVNFTYN